MTLHPISGKSYLLLLALLLISAFAPAQTAVPVVLAPVPQLQFFDQSGRPLSFGCVFTFQSQTTTPLATFSDFTGQYQNQNPVLLNAGGSANIWLQSGQAYSLVVKSSGGANCALGQTIYTVDGVGGGASQLTTVVTPSGGSAAFTVQSQNQLFTLTLAANTAGQPVTFIGTVAPAIITFQITEDGGGAHTFSWPSNMIGAAPIDTTANHTTSQTFIWNGTTIMPVGSGFTSVGTALFGNVVADRLNAPFLLGGGKYSCTTAGLQSALADALTAGGGTVDAQFCPTLSLTAATTIGDGASAVALIVPNHGTWTLTGITNGTDCFLKVKDGSSIFGFGTSNDANKLTLQSGSASNNADSMICTDYSGTGGYYRIEGGFLLYNQAPSAGTFVHGLLHAEATFDASSFRNITIVNINGIGFYTAQVCCGTTFEKIVVDGQNQTGAIPVVIDSKGSLCTCDVSFINLSADHAGNGHHEIEVKETSLTTGPVNFYNTYVETGTSESGATHVQLTASHRGINFYGGMVNVRNAADTAYCFDVTAASGNQLGLYGMSCVGNTNAVSDHNSPAVTLSSDANGVVPDYRSVPIYLRGGISSVFPDGTGYKHKRFGATCSTGATTGNTCTTTYSWTTAFADANYTPVCTPVGPTQLGLFSINSFNAAGVTILIDTATNASASYSGVDCVAVHD
jgi:hypothetical protein